MVFFNYSTMQMVAKVVYYGPGLCGKTTNLNHIYEKTSPKSRGEMVSLATETDRTLFFDLLPLDVGLVGGFKTKFQLYTVPGQVFYNMTRKLVLKGVDGIVFVADSQVPMLDANVDSFENLRENLEDLGLGFDTIPLVFQYNKRDLPNITALNKMNAAMNPLGKPFVEASALNGEGVFETLKEISKLTLVKLKAKVVGDELKQSKASVEFKVQGSNIKKQIEEETQHSEETGSLEKTVVGEGDEAALPVAADESLPGLNAPVPEVVSFEDYTAPAEHERDLDSSLSSINFDMIELDEFEDEIDKLDQMPDVPQMDDSESMDEIAFEEEPEVVAKAPSPDGDDALKSLDSIASMSRSTSTTSNVKTQSVDAMLGDLFSNVGAKKKKKGDRFQIQVPEFSQAQVNCIFLDDAGNVVHSKLFKVTPISADKGREIRLVLEIDEG